MAATKPPIRIKSIQRIEERRTAKGSCDCGPAAESSPSSCCPPQSKSASASCCPPAAKSDDRPPCCGPATTVRGGVITDQVPGFLRWLSTPAGEVAQISSTVTLSDHLGACKARWGIGRMSYIVPPGLYALGTPGADDPVLVTANYKMTYDILRQTLHERNLWLLVLETFGVNVWCAAGKGTFGTDELIERIAATSLARVVNHRRLILPILGAPGVAAHKVQQSSGFTVRYGTIRAADLPAYLDNGQVTTPAMRELTFTLYERLVLIPVEIVHALPTAAVVTLLIALVALFSGGGSAVTMAIIAWLGTLLTGIVIGPLLLPWLPGRSFALKGAVAGLFWGGAFVALSGFERWQSATLCAIFLLMPAVSAFYTLNFTGCATYTSPNGVRKEMRRAMPLMGLAILIGTLLLLWQGFM